ncbi:hypothetical protein [Vibrio genomosp. F10]|uniref:hypothetical protein n=1 Tax=Vibrio genomosp. F10 TaxID=723171 RepID=UPI00037EBB59|nr:hypothetical protein [Vibrio genomosp. F10]OEE98214.1 hypothetical protein A1QK_12425 [Vibrio genomosp. F10 str. 9ZD137]
MKYNHKLAMFLTCLTIFTFRANATMVPEFEFHEGTQGKQDTVCNLTVLPGNVESINFKKDDYGCDNDKAKSLTLRDVPEGTVIKIYDDPKLSSGDDYLVITVTEDIFDSYIIGNFEQSYIDETVNVYYSEDNGLNGKVSAVRIVVPEVN